MLPPELVVKLRKRVEESDSGVRAAVHELEEMQASTARGARHDAARRTRLLDAVHRKLVESASGSEASSSLAALAASRSRVAVVLGRERDPEDGPMVVWTGVLLGADAQWNMLLGAARRYLVGHERAGRSGTEAPEALRVDPATGEVTGASVPSRRCWPSVSAVLGDAARGGWAEAEGQTLFRGAAVQAVLRHPCP